MAAVKTPEMTQAIDILCSWAIENDVDLEIQFIQDVAAGIIRRSDIFEDKTIPYMIVVRVKYKNNQQRIIFDPATLHMYKKNLDIIKESFDNVVDNLKKKEK